MSVRVRFEVRLQREALQAINFKAGNLNAAIDAGSWEKAVTCAGEVAGELRTASICSLPIDLYNDVYYAVGEKLRVLENWIVRERSARRSEDALRKAQEHYQIVPRLYVTTAMVGACCELQPSSAKDHFSELMDLLSGVQHPLRGIFLRAFVTQQLRKAAVELGLQNSIKLLIRNLVEMTRLWVRMDTKKDIMQVKILIGQTLSAIGRLDLDTESYARTVLPKLTEIVLSCPESNAQEYLAECIVQVFSDELHLATLDSLLGMCQELARGVRLRVVISALTERLGSFVSQSPESAQLADSAEAFQTLAQHLPLIEARMGDKLSIVDRLGMYLALLRYTLRAEPSRLDSVDKVLGFTLQVVPEEGFEHGSEPEELVGKALTEPLIAHQSVTPALNLANFRELAARLSPSTRRTVGATMLKSVTEFSACLSEVGDLERLFELVGALVVVDESSEEIDEEAQSLVARIVFLLDGSDNARLFNLFEVLRKRLAPGGAHKARITFPSLILSCLRLAVRISDDDPVEFVRVCEFAMETIGALVEADPLLALRLYLEGLCATASCLQDASTVAYDFTAHAIVLYEEHLEGNEKLRRSAFNGLMLILGSVGSTTAAFGETEYKTLTNRLFKHAVFIQDPLKRCICLCHCARVYWAGRRARSYEDESFVSYSLKQVTRCLTEARNTAMSRSRAMDRSIILLEVLETTIFLRDSDCPLDDVEWFQDQQTVIMSGFEMDDKNGSTPSHLTSFSRQRFARLQPHAKTRFVVGASA